MTGILLLDLIDHRRVELLASLGHKEALTIVKPLDISRFQLVKESLELLPNSDRVQFAIDCAKRVLHIFENKYPGDNRPRKAIKAAELVLVNDTDETRALAKNAANAAWAANAAAYDAVYDAVYAPADAVNAAAWAANVAAYATYTASTTTHATKATSVTTWAAADAVNIVADKEIEIRTQNQQLVLLILQAECLHF